MGIENGRGICNFMSRVKGNQFSKNFNSIVDFDDVIYHCVEIYGDTHYKIRAIRLKTPRCSLTFFTHKKFIVYCGFTRPNARSRFAHYYL